MQLKQSADLLLDDLDALCKVLERRAREYKLTPTIGRSHGIHAEPVTFGLKLAQAYAEFDRNRARLKAARDDIATCAISGAVGTFANIDPRVEEHVAAKLGLRPEPVSTQVIPRDRHAAWFAALAVVASSVERLAVEIRHLQLKRGFPGYRRTVVDQALSEIADSFEAVWRQRADLADRIHVLDYGRTIAEGAPERVLNDPNVLAAYLGVEA